MNTKRVLASIGKRLLAIAITAAVLWLLGFVFSLNMKSYVYSSFGSGEHQLWVIGISSLGVRYAAVQVADRAGVSNVVLEAKEVDGLLELVKNAKKNQSPLWRQVGTISESGTIDPSRLTISAGPGMRFAIVDEGICARYDLAQSDFVAFERAAQRARRHFDGDKADEGLTPLTASQAEAFHNTNETIASMAPRSSPGCR